MLVSGRVRVIEFMTHLGESCPKSSRSVTGQESSPRRCHPIATISHCRPAGPSLGVAFVRFFVFFPASKNSSQKNQRFQKRSRIFAKTVRYFYWFAAAYVWISSFLFVVCVAALRHCINCQWWRPFMFLGNLGVPGVELSLLVFGGFWEGLHRKFQHVPWKFMVGSDVFHQLK